MIIQSTKLADSIGDKEAIKHILENEEHEIQIEDIPDEAVIKATENLTKLTQLNLDTLQNYTINISISDTQESREAMPKLMPTLANAAFNTQPSASEAKGSHYVSPISISPTVGGMGIGLVGGVGLGITVDALRNTASSSGNPVIGSIAIGLGLLGTAVGGYLGSGGAIKFKGFGVEVTAENNNQ